MATTYNASSPGTRDKLRLMIGDTDTSNALFTDEELDIFLDLKSNDLNLSAAQACRTIAIDQAKQAILYRTMNNDLQVDRKELPKYMFELAKTYEERAEAEASTQEYMDEFAYHIDEFGRDRSSYE